MPSDPPRKPFVLLAVSVGFLALAILEAVMATVTPSQSGGANIGLAIALFAAMASGASVGLAAFARSLAAESRAGFVARVGACLSLLVAGAFLLLVGIGILEELQ